MNQNSKYYREELTKAKKSGGTNMDFTVLATSYNDSDSVKEYLDNFEKQTLKPLELIIVDGGSADHTVEILNNLKENYSFKITIYSGLGRLNISQGYNEGIKRCKTDMLLLTGIGNSYNNNFCESVATYYESHSIDVVYTPIIGINNNGFSKAFNIAFVGGKNGKLYDGASNRGAMLSKSVFEKIGFFYEKFIYAGEDEEFFNRVKEHGMKMACNTDTRLYWETPKTFKEYLIKTKVNAIAEMQLCTRQKLISHILCRLMIMVILIMAFFDNYYIGLGVIVVLCLLIAFHIKSFHPMAIFLRIHFLFLPSYYYLKYTKYMLRKYHFNICDIPCNFKQE